MHRADSRLGTSQWLLFVVLVLARIPLSDGIRAKARTRNKDLVSKTNVHARRILSACPRPPSGTARVSEHGFIHRGTTTGARQRHRRESRPARTPRPRRRLGGDAV